MRSIDADNLLITLHCNGLCGNTPEECVAEAIEFVNLQATIDKWIPVSERLSELFDYVLVTTKDGGRTIAHRMPNQTKSWYDLHSKNVPNIIAWQPLPQPYKEKTC